MLVDTLELIEVERELEMLVLGETEVDGEFEILVLGETEEDGEEERELLAELLIDDDGLTKFA